MRGLLRNLVGDRKGAAAVEFGLAIPVALVMLLGALNMGIYLYFKNSMTTAIDETARAAILYPQPSDAELSTKFESNLLTAKKFGSAAVTLTRGTSTDGRKYVELVGTGSYKVNLVFVNLGSLPVRSTRRAYFQE
ncbi:TadE/TadG family type IV pilus assembly protein [Qipengyuania sp. RANM35]|uniref:TadE/TadG family type IV pilus assembly protein n=1 Tax=Qipengyuania sp. RANM35 TaxID=3068635 RepID=UPI0034DB473B